MAGLFYPANRAQLQGMLDGYLARSKNTEKRKNVIGVVAPHAGYVYSGLTAAYSYNQLVADRDRCFLIVGPKHSGYPPETCVFDQGAWISPLGDVNVNSEIADLIIEQDSIYRSPEAFEGEHSIEVQVPWLQRISDGKCTIVPVSMGKQGIEQANILAEKITAIDERPIIIASSDLTHYEPANSVNNKDQKMIDSIISLDVKRFYETILFSKATPCGYGPIATLMLVTKSLDGRIDLLNHSNSGDATADYSSVVGYPSLVSYIPG